MIKSIGPYFLTYITTALIAVVMSVFVVSCKKKETPILNVKFDPEVTPSLVTDSVVTLISDSGITRYKLIADVWQIFDRAKRPYWYFPEKFYLERFDEGFNVEATIKADTAWHFIDEKLWQLKGHVEVINMSGDEFKTDELFWDQSKAKVYSDKYIEIKRGQLELKGYGFESNQEMTEYSIYQPREGKLPIQERSSVAFDTIPSSEKSF